MFTLGFLCIFAFRTQRLRFQIIKIVLANVQIIGMSATIGNLPEICTFLNAEVYTKDFRPVELIEYIKCGKEIAKINWNYTEDQDLLIEPKKVNYKVSEKILLSINGDLVLVNPTI